MSGSAPTTLPPMPAPPAPRIDPRRLAAWRAFLEAHAAVVQRLAEELEQQERLALTWYDVLVHLSEAPDHRLRMQDLAGAVLLSKSGLTRVVDRMEERGLVTRRPCEDDRRGTWAELTEEGYATLRRTAPSHIEGVKEHFADLLAESEVEPLVAALERIAAAARGGPEVRPPAGPAGRRSRPGASG